MTIRVLCLGNPLLADDALGFVVADEIRKRLPGLQVVETSAAGFDLLDHTLGATKLIVVDTFKSGTLQPGSVSVIREGDLQPVPGSSPHYVGLFEALRLGKELQMPVPQDVVIIAVEPADCLTVGGPMHPAVAAAIPEVVKLITEMS